MVSKAEARALLAHLNTELGSYPHWKAGDIEAFLKQGVSAEEITAEYRERLDLYDQFLRRKAKETIVLLRAHYGRVMEVTEQMVLEWIRGGNDDGQVATTYYAYAGYRKAETAMISA
ncbi:hypothetical protein SVAN01_09307 [Stagonosporopsis vannaccii]|nr:hypothetical protein SVAN01_09307 [Stagonosporopsis vannaccii]